MQLSLMTENKKPSQATRILRLLQTKGSVSNVELNHHVGFRYSARLLELRKLGYQIETGKTDKFGRVIYTYKGVK